jgi:hypothetical protein
MFISSGVVVLNLIWDFVSDTILKARECIPLPSQCWFNVSIRPVL